MVPALNYNFYNLNGLRRYPLDDFATGDSDAGDNLPNDIIVDCSIRFPTELGQFGFVSSVRVTESLVSVTFLACPSPITKSDFQPLAAISLPKPIDVGRAYQIEALAKYTAGWVVFGNGANTRKYSGKFSNPPQSLLAAKVARPYHRPPVSSLGKQYLFNGLTGRVLLKGSGDIEVVKENRRVDFKDQDVIVVRLKMGDGFSNVFETYAGPCGGRPESGSCVKTPLQYINGVSPDCDGNLTLQFGGDIQVLFYDTGSGGIVLDYPLGHADVCRGKARLPDAGGNLPGIYQDPFPADVIWEGEHTVSEGDPGDDNEEPPRGGHDAAGNRLSLSSGVVECSELPYVEKFADLEATNFFINFGTWSFDNEDDPTWEPATYESLSSLSSSLNQVEGVLIANSAEQRNVITWDDCAYGETSGLVIETSVKIIANNELGRAGLVLGYHPVGIPVREEYHTVEINVFEDKFVAKRFNGAVFIEQASSGGLFLSSNHWYRIKAKICVLNLASNLYTLRAWLWDDEGDRGLMAEFAVVLTNYGPDDGKVGLGSDRTRAKFGYFGVQREDC